MKTDINYKTIITETNKSGSYKFQYKNEEFELFIDWEKDLCLTHYSNKYNCGQNSWFINDINGLKYKLKKLN